MGSVVPLAALADSLISAAAGLLGVVVGAGLGVVAEERRKRGDLRAAARLADAELADTFARIEPSVGAGGAPSRALAATLETPAWLEGRSALALGLQPEEWGRVRDAFAAIVAYRAGLVADGPVEREGRAALEAIRAGREVLAPVSDMAAAKVRVRRMTVDDFAAVYGLGRACWRPVDVPYNWWSLAEVADHLEHHPRLCLVAEAEGRVVGFVLGAATFELDADTGHLEWLAVDPHYRRAGVATRLVETALEVYRQLGRRCVAADIASGNEASMELVRRIGFVESVSVTFFTKELGPPTA